MFAALYGDVEDVRLLLAQGADANAQNDGGGTALMYAIEDAEKTRLLLDRGADVNARSGEGRTALLIAVGRAGSNAVVKLLLERGASASVRLPDGRGALQLAVAARDAALLSMLLDHGAGKTPLPLGNALLAGCTPCFEMLLKLAEPGDLNGALTAAVRLGDLPVTQDAPRKGCKTRPQYSANRRPFRDNDSSGRDPDADRSRRGHPHQDLAGAPFSNSRTGTGKRRWWTRSAKLASRIKALFLRC